MKPYIPPKIMITFTINDITYQAEDGMTWGQWVNTEYNTGGFYILDDLLFDRDYNSICNPNKFGIVCYNYMVIENNATYGQISG